jgi:hypothetical protein
VVFNRNKNLSSVLQQIPGVVESHPLFKRAETVQGETTFRFVFAHRDDPNRELTLTILVFEVPSAQAAP